MRERQENIARLSQVVRITHAPAGNTDRSRLFNRLPQDHPRACGKHLHQAHILAGYQGSPPRLRETQPSLKTHTIYNRITPAPAGNTSRMALSSLFIQDHPRACGKHCWWKSRICTQPGSPPRLRETLGWAQRGLPGLRITPAPAGNTFAVYLHLRVTGDHPRACGKHDSVVRERVFAQGSPPRLRETQTMP